MIHATARLSILTTLSDVWLAVSQDWRYLVALSTVPVLGITVARLAVVWGPNTSAVGLIAGPIEVIMGVMLIVACHRFFLLGDRRITPAGLWTWSRRETWVVLYILTIGGVSLLAKSVFYRIVWMAIHHDLHRDFLALLPNSVEKPILSAIGFTLGLITGYVLLPLFLIIPATAIDQRGEKRWVVWTWSLSWGNRARFLMLSVLVGTPLYFLPKTPDLLHYAGVSPILVAVGAVLLSALHGVATIIIGVALLSSVYKQVSIWGAKRSNPALNPQSAGPSTPAP